MNIKILVIEDSDDVADRLKSAIETKLKHIGHEAEVVLCNDFDAAPKQLRRLRPHAVTLDLKKDPLDDHAAKPAWEVVRSEHFCPVLFYSAVPLPPDVLEGELPFAKYLRKAADDTGDESAAAELLGGFVPHIEGLQTLWNDVEGRYAESVAQVSQLIWDSEPEANRAQTLIRVTRRRLAAMLERPLGEDPNIKAWEQFIYPPTDKDHLCTGDVVFQRGEDRTQAINFRIILTPPCDLVPGQNAVDSVLIGKCIPANSAEVRRRGKVTPQGNLSTREKDKLCDGLVKDEIQGLKLIPKLGDLWPTMVLDFKSLELVPRTAIALSSEEANTESKFERIASMDSPFREALSWRFMQTAGRPGTPDADRLALETEIRAAT
jgi:hypothetical protein